MATERIRGFDVIHRRLANGPSEQTPRRIIVHAMGHRIRTNDGEQYAASFLDSIGLSAHVLVGPDGTIIRCRSDYEGAWHAKGYNTDSLGIEVLVDGAHNFATFVEMIKTQWVTTAQYRAAVAVCAEWLRAYQLTTQPGEFDRHSDVDPERKSDPGQGFPWERFKSDVEKAR